MLRPTRIGRLFLWADRKGWRLNLALLIATFLTATLAGGSVVAAGNPFVWPRILLRQPSLLVQAGVPYALALVAILGAHEMGHYLACRYYRVDATLPFFLPMPLFLPGTLGAVIRIKEPIPDRKALFDIGIAGPLAGFAVLLPVLALGLAKTAVGPLAPGGTGGLIFTNTSLTLILGYLIRGPLPAGMDYQLNPFLFASWVGMLVTAMNLFPIGQLDGGHVCYAISRRVHRAASRLTLLGLAIAVVYGVVRYGEPLWLLWLLLLAWMGPWHPPVLDEQEPLSAGRRLVAGIGLLVFMLCFSPVPLYIAGP